jgi:hypothetical protein
MLKIVDVAGLRVSRQLTLAFLAGPELQGPSGAFRRFALEHKNIGQQS